MKRFYYNFIEYVGPMKFMPELRRKRFPAVNRGKGHEAMMHTYIIKSPAAIGPGPMKFMPKVNACMGGALPAAFGQGTGKGPS